MFTDQRKSARHVVNRVAKLMLPGGAPPLECLITDISDGGVRLHIEGVDVPERFGLLIADSDGHVESRDCRVVWRLGLELGAKFLDTFDRTMHDSSVAERHVRA